MLDLLPTKALFILQLYDADINTKRKRTIYKIMTKKK